jgi:hypothetical protein
MYARPRSKVLPVILGLTLLCVAILLAWRGWSFYKLGLEARVEHPEYQTLRPSGIVGNGYGFLAAILFLTNLSYLARRRLAMFKSFGSMRIWLDVHVFTGLLGALFVAFHSAFQARSTLSTITAASLAVVVVTGIFGRFLHAIINHGGKWASRAEKILRSWRSLHRLSALLMLLTVAVHIGVAWHFGYRWIFD